MLKGVAIGLVTLALLPGAPRPDLGTDDAAPSVAKVERPASSTKTKSAADRPRVPARAVKAQAAAQPVPDMGTLIVCVTGVDTFVAASGTSAIGGNLAFGVRDGECRSESVPGGRYLVRIQGGRPAACSGAIAAGSCEIGRAAFDHTTVSSNVQGSYARFDRPEVDMNVADGGTTTVTFVFAPRRL